LHSPRLFQCWMFVFPGGRNLFGCVRDRYAITDERERLPSSVADRPQKGITVLLSTKSRRIEHTPFAFILT
jgi:hypothetical protein